MSLNRQIANVNAEVAQLRIDALGRENRTLRAAIRELAMLASPATWEARRDLETEGYTTELTLMFKSIAGVGVQRRILELRSLAGDDA